MKRLGIFLLVGITVIKIVLSQFGLHDDMLSNAGWGEWIWKHGSERFYQNNVWVYSWPTQPPLMNLVYGFDRGLYSWFVQGFWEIGHFIALHRLAPTYFLWFFRFESWFASAHYNLDSDFFVGYLMSIKLLPILSDFGIAMMIYFVSKKLVWPVVFLLSPFSWYISTFWGQYDSVAGFLLLASFLLLVSKRVWLAPVLFTVSILIKPTGLPMVPLFGLIFFQIHRLSRQKIVGILLSVCVIVWSFMQFSATPAEIFQKVFFKSEMRVGGSAFNFWKVVVGNTSKNQATTYVFVPAWMWGMGVVGLAYLYIVRKKYAWNVESTVFSVWLISSVSWLFQTNMLERFGFVSIVSGLMLTIFRPKLFWMWLVMSGIFWLSLYRGWWFPYIFPSLQAMLVWNEGVVLRVLAAANVVLFLTMFKRRNIL